MVANLGWDQYVLNFLQTYLCYQNEIISAELEMRWFKLQIIDLNKNKDAIKKDIK